MPPIGTNEVWMTAGMMGALSLLFITPKSFVMGVFAVFGISRRRIDKYVQRALDSLLAEDCARLRKSIDRDVLDFHTSVYVLGTRAGIGWQRVKIVRTISKRIRRGYRIKIRAFGLGAKKRRLVRAVTMDLRARK